MIDTMIVSSADKTAISGVALVDSVNYLIILVFGALATGGAVVISQFIEKRIWKTVNLRHPPCVGCICRFGCVDICFCFFKKGFIDGRVNIVSKKMCIIPLVIMACVLMGIVDTVIQPGYAVKSAIKMLLFLLIPFLYGLINKECNIKAVLKPSRKGFLMAVVLGILVYGVVLGAYFLFRNVFDFSALVGSLDKTTGVNKSNFLWVAIYISFVNSFLEEFFFRGYAFLIVKKFFKKHFAYIFSSIAFALYHIAMMIGWFGLSVILISVLGLFAGGMIFNKFDEKNENIYLSWLVHMFANFATNTIGFMLFST